MFAPIASNSGRARANASSGPPTMIDSVAFVAPFSPPQTGASSISTPCAASRLGDPRVACGIDRAHVDHERARARSPTPPRVRRTTHELHVGRVGQHRDHDVGDAGDLGRRVGSARPGRDELVHRRRAPRVHREVESRLEQMPCHGRPMMPSPMNPMRSLTPTIDCRRRSRAPRRRSRTLRRAAPR